jgi:hypothetical protein
MAARFVPGSPHLWVAMRHGKLRRLSLDGGAPSQLLVHRAAQGAEDLFELSKRLGSRQLAVSPTGRFVAFGYPNDFLNVGALQQPPR